MLNYSALINILLRSYRFIICKIFFKNYQLKIVNYFTDDEIDILKK